MTPTPVTVRPLPGTTFITRLSGVSFHQDVTAGAVIGDRVSAVHPPHNPVDPDTVEVRTTQGRVLGYIPAKTGLHSRLVAGGGHSWAGVVTDTYDSSEGYPRSITVTLTLTPVHATENIVHEPAIPIAPNAYTASGRLLGPVTHLDPGGGLATITVDGVDADYPLGAITLRPGR